MNTEMIVYLARKLHWARSELGNLHPAQAMELFNELAYQESQEDWRNQYNIATILAAIYNTIPTKSHKFYQAKDFFNAEKPNRGIDKVTKNKLDSLAEETGIRLPQK